MSCVHISYCGDCDEPVCDACSDMCGACETLVCDGCRNADGLCGYCREEDEAFEDETDADDDDDLEDSE